MADGFGFRFEDAAAADQASDQKGGAGKVTAGTGAGPVESWWGELVEFALPFVAIIGVAVLIALSSPNGVTLLTAGWRT